MFYKSRPVRNKWPNGNGFSRAQGLLTDQDDDHANYLSQKARVFGVGCKPMLGQIFLCEHKALPFMLLAFVLEGNTPLNCDAFSVFALALRLGTTLTLARE